MSFRIRYVIRDHQTLWKIHRLKLLVTESEADRPERRNMLPNVHPEKLFLRFPSTFLYLFCDIKWQKFQGRIWTPVRQDKQIFYVPWSIRRKARAHNFRINKNQTSHALLASHGGRALWKGSPPPTTPPPPKVETLLTSSLTQLSEVQSQWPTLAKKSRWSFLFAKPPAVILKFWRHRFEANNIFLKTERVDIFLPTAAKETVPWLPHMGSKCWITASNNDFLYPTLSFFGALPR